MNVLQFICPTGFYGAERWIIALAKNLNRDEVNCELVVTREPEIDTLEIVQRYQELDLACHEIAMNGRFDRSVIDKLVRLIKERNIDIIHTHGYKSDILGVIAARRAGIRSVCTPHGFENDSDLKLRFFIWLGCQSFRFFDKVVPLSRQLMEDVKKFNLSKNKLMYVQNGVDLSEVENIRDSHYLRKKGRPLETKQIGFIGQMIGRKNIRDVLDIFDSLCQELDNIELVLVGDGEEAPGLKSYTDTLMSRSKINFLGFRNDRLELLAGFDLFVMTSSLEGVPRCLMECMAMGVPVAAYNIPGIDMLVDDGHTGLSTDFGDKPAMKEKWKVLLEDDVLAGTLSDNARQKVIDEFSGERMAKEYTHIFRELVQV